MNTGPHTNYKQALHTYPVRKVEADITLTGTGEDRIWEKAHNLMEFSYPWEKTKPHPTKFRALHNARWVYCLFDVTDPDVNILQETNDKWEVASSSRAEIFFKFDNELTPYYCLELDPLGRVLDYKAMFYRKFDFKWAWPHGQLLVKTGQSNAGYSVEIAVSKVSLRDLALLKADTLQTGLYRADCSVNTKGERDLKWISWIKPDSETPDFHIPSSFGTLHLED